jgi:hypothetical protein
MVRFFFLNFLGTKLILIITLNDKLKTKKKNKLQQIWESDSLTRVLGGSWNLRELTWKTG